MYSQRLFSRSISRMTSSAAAVSPFTLAVVGAMRKLYPEKLADSSFDNNGLLLEAPYKPKRQNNSVLLTVDLTKAVADEAIARKDSIIIAYHPIIFRPLKSLSLANSQQNSLLRLAQEGISVYSPHTAVDATPGGLNDWLADIITSENPKATFFISNETPPSARIVHERSRITPVKEAPQGFEEAGYGQVVRFHTPEKLGVLVTRIIQGLGGVSGLSVAVPQSVAPGSKSAIDISSVGICAGSGGSILNGLDVDLLFTGELSHHEALAAVERGKCVITAFHSNTERGFLMKRMWGALCIEVGNQIKEMTESRTWEVGLQTEFSVAVSTVDRDPFEIITQDQTKW